MRGHHSRSLAEEIALLARLTDAPTAFVEQVCALFEAKGVSLDEDAEPFLAALEEAFRREEMIRSRTAGAARDFSAARSRLGSVRAGSQQNVELLKQVRETLEDSCRRMRESGRRLQKAAYVLSYGRRYVSDTPRVLLVPGPKDIQ